MAAARSSWSTSPQASSDLLVVKIMERRLRWRSVDDVEEHVRGVVAVREVADLIDDEHVQVSVLGDGFAETAMPASHRELLDERRGGDEERVEAVLDRR